MVANDNEDAEHQPEDWLESIEGQIDALLRTAERLRGQEDRADVAYRLMIDRDRLVATVECALGLTSSVLFDPGAYPTAP